MNKKLLILGIIVLLSISAGAYYLGTQNSKTVVVTSAQKPSSSQAATTKQKKEVDLVAAMNAVKAKFPTVEQSYIYTEQQDPNNNLGKPGYYVAGANFYDTRTSTPPDGAAFGTDSGGAIEVYSTSADAAKRADYLKSFQGNGMLDPGAYKQVGRFVLRASSKYTKSQQDEVLAFLVTQVQ